jgi:hypothetical protein
MPSPEQRRARHEGVERGPELQAVAILLLQDFMLGAGNDQMRAGAQMINELLDRRRRNDAVIAGRQHQDRLADPRRIMHRAEGVQRWGGRLAIQSIIFRPSLLRTGSFRGACLNPIARQPVDRQSS